MWWFWLAQIFGGSPIQWVIAVGMFSGCMIGYWLLYHLEVERNRAMDMELKELKLNIGSGVS